MKQFKTDCFNVYYENGIIITEFLIPHVEFEHVDLAVKKRLELFGSMNLPMLSDIRRLKSGTREAKLRITEKDAGIGVSAVGVLINSHVQKVIMNFVGQVYKAPTPYKIFTNREKAIAWLRKYTTCIPQADEADLSDC